VLDFGRFIRVLLLQLEHIAFLVNRFSILIRNVDIGLRMFIAMLQIGNCGLRIKSRTFGIGQPPKKESIGSHKRPGGRRARRRDV
jgi:hypothetical protein